MKTEFNIIFTLGFVFSQFVCFNSNPRHLILNSTNNSKIDLQQNISIANPISGRDTYLKNR